MSKTNKNKNSKYEYHIFFYLLTSYHLYIPGRRRLDSATNINSVIQSINVSVRFLLTELMLNLTIAMRPEIILVGSDSLHNAGTESCREPPQSVSMPWEEVRIGDQNVVLMLCSLVFIVSIVGDKKGEMQHNLKIELFYWNLGTITHSRMKETCFVCYLVKSKYFM